MKKIIFNIIAMILISCHHQKEKATTMTAAVPVKDSAINKVKFTSDMVQNKKDFSCGMSVKSGIEDTCHYKGKVYGFCSTECKQDFLKNPAAYLSKK
jgi:YHS domain-containing protein